MKTYILYQLDSFTTQKFKGNPAGVVVNADGLDETRMQQIARELNNSETAFFFSSDSEEYDGEIRYFTPCTEVPICGHATIAAMYAKALEEHLDSRVLRIKTGAGVLAFEIVKEDDEYAVIMTQGAFYLHEPFEKRLSGQILDALGLLEDDVDARCPVQIASTGHPKVMIGIKSRQTLNVLTPNFARLTELSAHIDCTGYFVFTLDSDERDVLTYGRMFAPAIGIQEDPVTGNANGPLGAYLIAHKLVEPQTDTLTFTARQGETIGRPGAMEVTVSVKNGTPTLIRIKGKAVVVFKTGLVL